jgi:hypothetical protein
VDCVFVEQGRSVAELIDHCSAELARLMMLATNAREAGNDDLADQLNAEAAKCLMRLADMRARDPTKAAASARSRSVKIGSEAGAA